MSAFHVTHFLQKKNFLNSKPERERERKERIHRGYIVYLYIKLFGALDVQYGPFGLSQNSNGKCKMEKFDLEKGIVVQATAA